MKAPGNGLLTLHEEISRLSRRYSIKIVMLAKSQVYEHPILLAHVLKTTEPSGDSESSAIRFVCHIINVDYYCQEILLRL